MGNVLLDQAMFHTIQLRLTERIEHECGESHIMRHCSRFLFVASSDGRTANQLTQNFACRPESGFKPTAIPFVMPKLLNWVSVGHRHLF